MLDKEKVSLVINCILNKMTIEETKKVTGLSKSTIENYIKALNNEKSNVYDPNLYQKVRLTQASTSLERNRLGGAKSQRTSKLNMEEKIRIVKIILERDFTLEEAAIYFKIPSSVLYDYSISIDDPVLLEELKKQYYRHHQDAFNHKVNYENINKRNGR